MTGGDATPTLRVVQLNAGTLLERGWAERRHEVVAWLERLQPDIACLQEIWEADGSPNTAGWIVEQLTGTWHWHFGGAPFADWLWPDPSLQFGSAVLSRWPIDAATYHRLPVAADPEDPMLTAVPWELLHVRTAGLDVFSCHLAAPPLHGRHRLAQVLAIDELVRAARGELDDSPRPGRRRPGMPAILCGDCNAEPDSDEIRFLTSRAVVDGRTAFWQDAWRVAGEGPGFTQDWCTNPIAASMNVHRKRIDYVLVGDPFAREGGAGRVLRADLAFHESLTGSTASDHAGLVVDLAWPSRPT